MLDRCRNLCIIIPMEEESNIGRLYIINETNSNQDTLTNIAPAMFLYIFEIIEKDLQVKINKIFEKISYKEMTINGITQAIQDMMN